MSKLLKPEGYTALLSLNQTEQAIKKIKDFFLNSLSTELRLSRVTAPLFVLRGLGINDDLNAMQRPKWCIRWQSGNGLRSPSIRQGRASASSPT